MDLIGGWLNGAGVSGIMSGVTLGPLVRSDLTHQSASSSQSDSATTTGWPELVINHQQGQPGLWTQGHGNTDQWP